MEKNSIPYNYIHSQNISTLTPALKNFFRESNSTKTIFKNLMKPMWCVPVALEGPGN